MPDTKPQLEKMSYLIETIREDLTEIKEVLKAQDEAHRLLRDEVQNFKIRGDTTVRIFKWMVGFFVALITFKFGDVKSLFLSLFGK